MSAEAKETRAEVDNIQGKHWMRPIPTIGDQTSARQRAQAPDGWAFDPQTISALSAVMRARRDIRRYRPDPVPDELVGAILQAAHQGPSVGHSQPWRFIIVDDPAVRAQAAVMSDRERLRQADLLTPQRRAQLLDLQLEGIREAPMGIVVACDRRTPASGVLGRNTFTDADLWSCGCAIQNMWLTARAHGLGMGWVTLFQPDELAGLLGLPEGVETLGWLCLGWPDERPPSPGLERRAWSTTLDLDLLIMRNRWADDEPQPPVNGLAVAAPNQQRVVTARDGADNLLSPPGSLGILDSALDKAVAAGAKEFTTARLVLAGADHPVTIHGVSAFDSHVTGEVMRAAIAGQSVSAATAKACGGFEMTVIDAGVNTPVDGAVQIQGQDERGDLSVHDGVVNPAMSMRDCQTFIEQGRSVVAGFGEPQLLCVGEVGIGNTTLASGLAAALTGKPVADLVGQGASSDSAMLERKIRLLDDALACAHGSPVELLAQLGGPELATLVGVIDEGARRGHVIVLDGLATCVSALVAVLAEPGLQPRLIASHVSREYGHHLVLNELGLEPLMALRLRAGEGVGACLGAQMLLSGLQIRRLAGRTVDATER